jgi:hypothetical protein
MNAEQPSLERLFCKAMKRCKKENSHPNTKKNNVQWNYNIYRSDIYTLDKTEGKIQEWTPKRHCMATLGTQDAKRRQTTQHKKQNNNEQHGHHQKPVVIPSACVA